MSIFDDPTKKCPRHPDGVVRSSQEMGDFSNRKSDRVMPQNAMYPADTKINSVRSAPSSN